VPRDHHALATRFVAWLRAHAIAVILASTALFGVALYLVVFHLPLRADFSYLLPQEAPAVVDLRKLEARVKSTDAILVIVEGPPEERAAAVSELAAGFRRIPSSLVEKVETDQNQTRAFLEANKHLLVPLEDLVRARDALRQRIDTAKLKANPLFIDIDDEPDPAAEEREKKQLDELKEKRKQAQVQLDRLSNVSADGRTAMIQVRTPFRSTNAALGEQLISALDAVRSSVRASHPSVRVGFTGSVITAVAEHRAISNGMILSSVITAVLVGLVLALYFRSATLLVLLVVVLLSGTAISFGAAALTVGHLNAATAFLGAIIAGNGINYGILLIARYLEERRTHDIDAAMSIAMVHTVQPTIIASLGAAIAYGSLAATSFKGFADFAVIGAVGMVIMWVATYTLLPVLVLLFGRRTRRFAGDPIIGRVLVTVLGFRRSTVVVVVSLLLAIGSAVIVARYIAADPFEYDIKNLRSEGSDAVEARTWMKASDTAFGRGFSGRTVIAADRLEQVPLIVEALRSLGAGKMPGDHMIGDVWSIFSFVPEDQDKKVPILDEIRAMIDEALEALPEDERASIRELRPPDKLVPITIASLPAQLRERFTEKNGNVGLLIEVRPAPHVDEWNGKDLIAFATAVRALKLRDGETVTTSGTSVIFADIVASIERDGPTVTLLASVALVIMVVLLVGANRRAFAVLAGTAAGSLLMVATCALLGIKVNFLDFVALPITLGLGIDYAINVAHRQGNDDNRDPILALQTSGSAVFMCSITTVIGYGSLLASQNLAIRGFGTASLIGEIACLLTALVVVPAIIAVRPPSRLPL
jgi:predicted RND superfamily exporter protein